MAIISGKSSKWGAILDSIVDRASEIFWMLALYKIGIDLKFLLIIIVVASTQEYIRARSGGLGLSEIGIVTIAERPVRASFVFILLILALLDFEFSNLFVYLWLVFQVVSFAMLIKHVRARLS